MCISNSFNAPGTILHSEQQILRHSLELRKCIETIFVGRPNCADAGRSYIWGHIARWRGQCARRWCCNANHKTGGICKISYKIACVCNLRVSPETSCFQIVATTTGYINVRRGIMSSGTQFLFWLLLGLFAIPQLRTEIQGQLNEPLAPLPDDELAWNIYKFVSYMIYFPLIILQLISNCFADKLPQFSQYTHTNISSKSAKPSPEITSSFLSKIFYAWFEPTMWKGFRNPLTTDNMYDLNPENTSYELLPLFDKYWQENVEKQRRKQQMSDKMVTAKETKGNASRRTNVSMGFC